MSDILARLQGLFRTEHDNQEMLRKVRRDIASAERGNATRAEHRRGEAETHYTELVRRDAAPHRAQLNNQRPLENGHESPVPESLHRFDGSGAGTGEGLFRSPEHRMLNQMEHEATRRVIGVNVPGTHDPMIDPRSGDQFKANVREFLTAQGPQDAHAIARGEENLDEGSTRRAIRHHYNVHNRIRPAMDRQDVPEDTRQALRDLVTATDEVNQAEHRTYGAREAGGRTDERSPHRVALGNDTRAHMLGEIDPAERSGSGTYQGVRNFLREARGAPLEHMSDDRASSPGHRQTRDPSTVETSPDTPASQRPENFEENLRRRRALERLSDSNRVI